MLLVDASLLALGTVLTLLMTSTAGQMAAISRLIAPEWRGLATGIVNAGGSFGQFVMAPVAKFFGVSHLATLFGRARSAVFSAPGSAARCSSAPAASIWCG